MFIHHLRSDPETAFDNHAAKYLRRDKIDALEQRFPRENYQLASQWAEAVTAELLSAATPAKVDLEAPGPGYRAAEVEAAARKWRTDQQVVGSITYARDLLEYEAKETERLNALIVKQTKFCAQLKAWEEAEEARNKN